MSPKPAPTPEPADARTQNTADLDRVSLTQALRDFEIANARVLDLTQRLVESERRRRSIEDELQALKLGGHAPSAAAALGERAARWALKKARGAARRVARRLKKD